MKIVEMIEDTRIEGREDNIEWGSALNGGFSLKDSFEFIHKKAIHGLGTILFGFLEESTPLLYHLDDAKTWFENAL